MLRKFGLWLLLVGSLIPGWVLAQGVESLLPVTEAYKLTADTSTPGVVHLHWVIAPDYYLYRGQMHFTAGGSATVTKVVTADGHRYHDQYLGDEETYHLTTDATVNYSTKDGAGAATLAVRYQGCHEVDPKICYPPHTEHLQLPPAPAAAGAAVVAASSGDAKADSNNVASPLSAGSASSFWTALLLAVAGGLLLNLMPCVLPVLVLKLTGLLDHYHERRAAARSAGLYTLGVMATFTALGLLVIELRHAGSAVGWGLQLQQPWLLGILACVMFAIGLSMSGLIHFGGSFSNTGHRLASRAGGVGDFFTGVLAVVVASPCTAPMMGAALAYAFVAPLGQALGVFLAMGFGLALPYLLIGLFPPLARLLPRPGAWMETLKQLLAFPMYVTVVWMVWLLARQRGADAVALALLAITCVALTAWAWQRGSRRPRLRGALLLPLLVLIALPLYVLTRLPAAANEHQAEAGVEVYNAQRLSSLVDAGTPVLVDMTADWCITCKANEHLVIDTPAFQQLLHQTGTVYMKGDWTNVDPAITRFLQRYHSPGVPLYVVFGTRQKAGLVLPSVLTQALVAKALQQAQGGA